MNDCMRIINFRSRIIITGLVLIISACERNNLEQSLNDCKFEISYTNAIAPLLVTNCALPDCHIGQSPIGDFNSYEEIKSRVENGKLKLLVFDLKSMPPDKILSEEELRKIECWIEQGAHD